MINRLILISREIVDIIYLIIRNGHHDLCLIYFIYINIKLNHIFIIKFILFRFINGYFVS
jgi:hypothetical protein